MLVLLQTLGSWVVMGAILAILAWLCQREPSHLDGWQVEVRYAICFILLLVAVGFMLLPFMLTGWHLSSLWQK